MGSSFDLFDEISCHDSSLINLEFLHFRNYLRNLMKRNGFEDYKPEWWHYTLKDEPFPNTYFDFEID
jgi:D-alanyl-D-alanine dipeptidase